MTRRDSALIAIALASLGAVGAALFTQYRWDMQPCPWCILQRVLFVVMMWLGTLAHVAAAIAPPSASTSLTRWPFPIPPIDGLHDICPMVSSALVTRATLAPDRAAATAASVPA